MNRSVVKKMAARSSSNYRSAQRFIQVSNQITHIFETNGYANQVISNAKHLPLFRADGCVRHQGPLFGKQRTEAE
jgi:hypothetical protein